MPTEWEINAFLKRAHALIDQNQVVVTKYASERAWSELWNGGYLWIRLCIRNQLIVISFHQG